MCNPYGIKNDPKWILIKFCEESVILFLRDVCLFFPRDNLKVFTWRQEICYTARMLKTHFKSCYHVKYTFNKIKLWLLKRLFPITCSTIDIIQIYKHVFAQIMTSLTNMTLKSSINFYIFEQIFYCQLLFTTKINKPQICNCIIRFISNNTKGTFHAKMGLIKDRNVMDLTEAEDIKKRWQEYTE